MATYLSAEALEQMKQELEHRRKTLRKEIAEKILHAKEMGDLSENFEYQTAKDEQAENESKVMELESKIMDAVIIEQTTGASEIALGTSFIVKLEEKEITFSLVGSSEADPLKGKISNESPIGAAFMGAKAGEDVAVETPAGTKMYHVVKIF